MKFFNKIFFFFFLLFSYSIFSQNSGYKTGVSNILNAANPEDIGVRTAVQVQEDKDDPLEYGYVNDKDILWSTTVWEIIDLDQRVNYPLLYPVDTSVVGDERRPMIWWLKQEIEKFNLPVYDASYTGKLNFSISCFSHHIIGLLSSPTTLVSTGYSKG